MNLLAVAIQGNHVIGIDVNPFKANEINLGKSLFLDSGLNIYMAEAVAQKRLFTTTNP